MKLADAQARFLALCTARDSVAAIAARDAAARAAIDAMIAGDARLPAVDRLDVYATMYFVRLHDVLRDEFPRTAAVLGGEAFHGLVTDYLVACPPNRPSLREAGARLPDFLARHALAGARPWLAELARLERARTEVFDGPDARPLALDDLRGVAP
ncbi:MAG TPA: DNA-binding domain-containing protein, partial [Polyangia bacterium]